MNIRYPLYEGVYRILTVYKLLGKELTWDDEPVELQTETEKR